MAFPERLARLRKARGLTQKDLASMVGLNQAQIHRYEKGRAEPSMSALKRLAQALDVITDELILEAKERGPDYDLRLQFAAVADFGADEKEPPSTSSTPSPSDSKVRRWAGTG